MMDKEYRVLVKCLNCLAEDTRGIPFKKKFINYDPREDFSGYYSLGHSRFYLDCNNCGLPMLEVIGSVQ